MFTTGSCCLRPTLLRPGVVQAPGARAPWRCLHSRDDCSILVVASGYGSSNLMEQNFRLSNLFFLKELSRVGVRVLWRHFPLPFCLYLVRLRSKEAEATLQMEMADLRSMRSACHTVLSSVPVASFSRWVLLIFLPSPVSWVLLLGLMGFSPRFPINFLLLLERCAMQSWSSTNPWTS